MQSPVMIFIQYCCPGDNLASGARYEGTYNLIQFGVYPASFKRAAHDGAIIFID